MSTESNNTASTSVPRRVVQWLREHKNLELAVSLAALIVSTWSILFSIYSFRKQFELDMRPFVGVVKVEVTETKSSANIAATIRNVGKLPANSVNLNVTWAILQLTDGKRVQEISREEQLGLIFPGAETSYTLPFESILFEKYVSRPDYQVVVDYQLKYSTRTIDLSWIAEQSIRYRYGRKPTIISSSGS